MKRPPKWQNARVKAAEETQGKNHPAVATMLNNLALLYQTRATLNQRCPYISAP